MTIPSSAADAGYLDFIHASARDLIELPPTVLSSLTGWPSRQLGPEVFEIVRGGHRDFALPIEKVYDDLIAAFLRRRSFPKSVDRWLRHALGYWKYSLWSAFTAALIFPLTSKRMQSPDPEMPSEKSSAAGAGGDGPPKTSVVVVSFNRLEYLRASLRAFWETVGDAPHELIVVDNGSTDGSAEFLEAAHRDGLISKLLLLPDNLGNSAGYNHGFALADPGSEYLVKLDSDIKPLTRGWLRQATDFLDGHLKIGLASLDIVNHSCLRMLPLQNVDGRKVMDIGQWTVGMAMIIPRRVFEEIGHFVERPGMTYVLDDVDYYARVVRKGYQAWHLVGLRAFHQTRLDATRYRNPSRPRIAAESFAFALSLAREYDRGDRPLELFLGQYQEGSEPRR